MSRVYRTVGRICAGVAATATFGYIMYNVGVLAGDGPTVSVHAHVTMLLVIGALGGLGTVAWMMRDLERRMAERAIRLNARAAAAVREAVVSDEVQDMLMAFLARGITRGMLIERTTNRPKSSGSKVHNGRPMKVVGREEV